MHQITVLNEADKCKNISLTDWKPIEDIIITWSTSINWKDQQCLFSLCTALTHIYHVLIHVLKYQSDEKFNQTEFRRPLYGRPLFQQCVSKLNEFSDPDARVYVNSEDDKGSLELIITDVTVADEHKFQCSVSRVGPSAEVTLNISGNVNPLCWVAFIKHIPSAARVYFILFSGY